MYALPVPNKSHVLEESIRHLMFITYGYLLISAVTIQRFCFYFSMFHLAAYLKSGLEYLLVLLLILFGVILTWIQVSVFCAAREMMRHALYPATVAVHRNVDFVVHHHCVCQWTQLLVVIESEHFKVLFIINHSVAAVVLALKYHYTTMHSFGKFTVHLIVCFFVTILVLLQA